MPRGIPSDLSTALAAGVLRVAFFVEVESSTPTYIWTGVGSVTIGGNTYTGMGDLISINTTHQSTDLTSNRKVVTLSGLSLDILGIFLAEDIKNKAITIKVGLFNADNSLAIASLHTDYTGFIEVTEVNVGETSFAITVTCIDKFEFLFKPHPRRYTPADQKATYPTDLGLDYVPTLQDNEIIWKAAQS